MLLTSLFANILCRGMSAAPPFVTHFTVAAGWTIPGTFAPGDFPGLLECRLQTRDNASALLICTWESQEVYTQAFAHLFRTCMGVGVPVFTGYEVRKVGEKKSLKDRLVSGYAGIVTLIAVVTNFGVLGDWATAVLASPAMSLTVQPWNGPVSQGDNLSLKMDLQNRGAAGELWVNSISSNDPSGLEIAFTPRLFPLARGAAETVAVPLKVTRSGEFEINVQSTMKAGWLHGLVPLSGLPAVPIVIWPVLDGNPRCEYSGFSGARSAIYRVSARHGHPPAEALSYEATMQHDGNCFFFTVDGEDMKIPRAEDFSSIRWRKKGWALREQLFTITVKSKVDRTKEYWESLKIEVTAVEFEKE